MRRTKRLSGILLSILVLYAGVAWALEKCWDHEGHAPHQASETHDDARSSLRHSYPSDDSFSPIHYCSLANQVGPAMTTARFKLALPIERLSLLPSHSILPVSMERFGPRSLVSLSRILTFSFYTGVPHHLFLSVIHI